MLTIDQLVGYCERTIAERHLAGDREGLRRVQLALVVLMEAAQHAGDRETARRFQLLASRSANLQEQLEGANDADG
ncbi:MAG: hypothetical protein SNJ69_09370 [Chloroflexaceae bacterium]